MRREIIVDSGASKHMIGINQLRASEKESIRDLSVPFFVQTAHGVVPCTKEARIYIHDLKQWVWAQLLEDSPAVLSLGLLCTQLGTLITGKKERNNHTWSSMARPVVAKPFVTYPQSP